MKLAILKNEFDDNHFHWEFACKKYGVSYKTIDLVRNDWLTEIMKETYDAMLACPSGRESMFKQLYDERINIIENNLNYIIYPNLKEILIHENKRFLSYWLKVNQISAPETWVFYNKSEAFDFARNCDLPIVGKFNIGASGKGVKIFRDRETLQNYIETAFGKGLRQNWGPNIKMGGFGYRLGKLIKNPSRIIKRLKVYSKNYNEIQKGFVILQQYVPHSFEWRIVKIGESYFGHQKVKLGDKASGSKRIDYITPADNLLHFVHNLCLAHNFNSLAVDIFENANKGYLVNEMQCIFGHVQSYICEKDGLPGRFKLINNKWIFEEGHFNENLSYNLRLENLLQMIEKRSK